MPSSALVTRHGVCALVNPPSQYLNTTHGLMVELTVPVRLITSGPHDMGAVERLNTALVAAWGVLRPIQPVTPEPWDAADNEMPTLLVPASREITCPMTAPTLTARAN